MREDAQIRAFCEYLDFPQEAAECFVAGYQAITRDAECAEKLRIARELFLTAEDGQYKQLLQDISERIQLHRYTVDMIFLLSFAPDLRRAYAEKGISEEIFRDTMLDLQYKLMECKTVYGVWGTFVAWWYRDFFRCKRFALGRLQFEYIPFPYSQYRGLVSQGKPVLTFHIPSSGPLRPDCVDASLQKAYRFYRCSGVIPVFFSSWLIYPPHQKLYPQNSNLAKFCRLFDMIGQKDDLKNGNYWRIFQAPFSPEALSDAPENTSLQRSFKRYLQEGNHMGSGHGMLLFDGEKILPPVSRKEV